MKAMKAAASGGMMRGPRGGMYRIVGGKKVYGGGSSGTVKKKSDHVVDGLKHVLSGGLASEHAKKLDKKGFVTSDHYDAFNKHTKAAEKYSRGTKERNAHRELAEAHLDIARSRY